jgi:uncharacterized membrane protein (UPF0182 family)
MVLGTLLCIALGASRFLARYHLVVEGHSKVVAGASYADVNFWLPGYNVMVACWFAAALILGLAAAIPRVRNWFLIRRSHWLAPVAALALLFVGAFVIPTGIEDFYVGPNQITLELPYLLRSIAATRQAYKLEGSSVEEREFAVSATPLAAAGLTKDAATLQDARIWDWRALEPQLQQIQGLRPYYTFHGVDIDRYVIDGAERQVMITARELDVSRLPAPAQVWVNLALKYTHGYGVVAVPVNEIDSRGNPVLWAHDIPVEAKKNLSVTRGEIYFGELTNDRVYVHTTEKEFDFPQGQANAETVYHCSAHWAVMPKSRPRSPASASNSMKCNYGCWTLSRASVRQHLPRQLTPVRQAGWEVSDGYLIFTSGSFEDLTHVRAAMRQSLDHPAQAADRGEPPPDHRRRVR